MENESEKKDKYLNTWDIERTLILNEKFESYYINNVSIQSSNFDSNILFSEIQGNEGDSVIVSPKVKVIVSMQFLKVLSKVLNDNIARYERDFGEIVVQPKTKPLLASAQKPTGAEILGKKK